MNEFKGFPLRMQFTPVPNIVFSSLLPQMNDVIELKALLYFLQILYPKKGHVRFVSYNELRNQAGAAIGSQAAAEPILNRALESLVARGILLNLPAGQGGAAENIYFLNNESNRLITAKIQAGEIILPGIKLEMPTTTNPQEAPNIFTLYEQNIGMLTPLIADELREAERHYPEAWIKEAFKESVTLKKRNWRYIARILERWSTEGKEDGTHRGNLKTHADPDKYIRGKYGHMVQR